MSGLKDFKVKRDHFKFDEESTEFIFPCCACKNRDVDTDYEPCRTCDHHNEYVEDDVEDANDE